MRAISSSLNRGGRRSTSTSIAARSHFSLVQLGNEPTLLVAGLPFRKSEPFPHIVSAITPIVSGVAINQKTIRRRGVEPDSQRAILSRMARPRRQDGVASGNLSAERLRNLTRIERSDHDAGGNRLLRIARGVETHWPRLFSWPSLSRPFTRLAAIAPLSNR